MGRSVVDEWDMTESSDGRYTMSVRMFDTDAQKSWTQYLEQISWSDLRQLHQQLTDFLWATEPLQEKGGPDD